MLTRKRSARGIIYALCILFLLTFPFIHTIPAHGESAHTVAWDNYSLLIDGQRVFIWSGEFHPYRLPSPDLWRDVLQKMKANGYNAVSIYVDWGFHSPAPGVYDFTGVRDVDKFLDIADEVGIYVIARPGPYINAEVDAGGFPGWLTTKPGTARTNNATYMSYTDEWQAAIDAVIARHQLTNGTGTVILYQIENEYASNITSSTGQQYMRHLVDKARADGITVPIFHNDKGRNGYWVPGEPGAENLDLYAFDGYPAGTCSTGGNPGMPGTPPDWGYYGTGGQTGGASASPNTPGYTAEFGGGWFDPWGDKLWGGAGYPCMTTRLGPGYEREYYLTNVANGIKLQNIYMTFGGTNWGWLAAPIVYTSYDYGAAINEARQMTDKVPAMKEMGYFVQSVESITKIDKGNPETIPATITTGPSVKIYHLTNPDTRTQFYLPRHSTATASNTLFTFPITTADGSYVIPQQGTLQLNGEDMKILTANYEMDSQHLVYATSEIMTHGTINGQDVALFDGRAGQTGEIVLRYSNQPDVTVLSGSISSTWDAVTGDLRLDYTHNGLAQVEVTSGGTANPLFLLIADDTTAATFWRQDTPAGMVLERGPQLVRTATVSGQTLVLTGDTSTSSDLEVWAPAGVTSVTWNGQGVATAPTSSGSLVAGNQLSGPPTITLPDLNNWKYSYETPESQPGFDDSSWAVANKTTSNSKTAIPSGQKVLFADDYGFHYGDVWYRGTYSGAASATAISLKYQTGQVGMLEAWLDGVYLGSNQIAVPTSSQSTTQTWSGTQSFTIPPSLRNNDTHLLAVFVRTMGHEEDGGVNDAFKNARGLTSATLTGSTATTISWKIQGNQGGENIVDTLRGPLNNGGLYGERAGWHLPGYADDNWTPVTLPYSDPVAGVAWYRTAFNIDVPAGVDASLGLNIDDLPSKAYRALIFVNGWNMGQYINNVGPQHTFILPDGILNQHGENTLAIAVVTNNAGGGSTGGGLGNVSLVNLGTAAGGVPVSLVDSPAYQAPVLSGEPVTGSEGNLFQGVVATVNVPQDAAGELSAMIDWGDGSQSAGSYDPATSQVSGSHTYANDGSYPITITVSDPVDQSTLAVGNTTAQIANLAPQVTVDLASQNVQYTDSIQPVTINATDVAADLPLSATTQWSLDGGTFQSGLPSWLALTPMPCTSDTLWGACSWTLASSATVPVQAGAYLVRTTVSDGTNSNDVDVTLQVVPEDAYLQYSGEAIASIGNELSLRVTAWDSASSGYLGANPETAPNATIGDITKMWVAFDLYSSQNCLSGTPTTLYAQVADTGTPGDGIGTASATFTSASEASYCVVARLVAGLGDGVNAWYTADYAEPAMLIFYENSGQFVTGGGWIDDPGGSKGNFGFTARANKKGQIQGHVVYVYRGVYQGEQADFIIKSNALNGLAFGGASYPIPATLQGKCTLQINRSSDGSLLFSQGNATFQATAVDSGDSSGSGDSFSILVYDQNGLIFKNVSTSQLDGGNVIIHQ